MATFVVLLGPPGAGKGTQAKRVAEELDICHVSSGDLFRSIQHKDTPLARKIRDILAHGELVPDDITIELVLERLAEDDIQECGAMLDGFPRTVPQAEAFDKMLAERGDKIDRVLFLFITPEEAVRRISGRRVCPTCGEVYHVEFNPPKVEGKCDKDGTDLVLREDDKPEVVRDRYNIYCEKTQPLVDYYKEKDREVITRVDAELPVDEITPNMVAAIREVLPTKSGT